MSTPTASDKNQPGKGRDGKTIAGGLPGLRQGADEGIGNETPTEAGASVGGAGEGMPHSTGQGVMCQISLAYSAMVRSVLNLPELAMFIRHMRAQREGCS